VTPIRSASPKLAGYAMLAALGLLGALVLGRPEVLALGAPFLLALAIGVPLATEPRFAIQAELGADRALEGDEVDLRVVLEAETAVARLDLYLALPEGVEMSEGGNPVSLVLAAGERRELDLRIALRRFGAHTLGPVYTRAADPLGLRRWESVVDVRPLVRAHPREEQLRRILRPRETQVYAGNEVARHKGAGIEFADLRPFAFGDPVRRINWRASARRAELYVNESHPERNTDVILFVDSFAEARLGDEGTLDLAVRATAALARAYLARRDRVGLVGFGGILRWLTPGAGTVQLHRIVDALLDTEIVLSYYWKDIDVLPRRTLPPNALVIALSPLLDARSVGALLDLRARGFDLAVIDVSPVPFTTRPAGEVEGVAYDVWRLHREMLRQRLREAAVAVAEWRTGEPLQAPLEEVRAFRRRASV
jgi:uncharacterized protein (DUF58 family)